MPGDYWRKFAGSRLFLSYLMFHPGKKLSFMGTEIGQFSEWDFAGSIEWFLLDYEMHKKHQLFVRDLNGFYLSHSQLWHDDHNPGGFRWLRPDDRNNIVSSFLRIDCSKKQYEELLVVLNYNYASKNDFIIDVPYSGKYREVFSSDNEVYGGSGCTNIGIIDSYKGEYGNDLIKIKLPPLAAAIFVIESADDEKTTSEKYNLALAEKAMREKKTVKINTESESASDIYTRLAVKSDLGTDSGKL